MADNRQVHDYCSRRQEAEVWRQKFEGKSFKAGGRSLKKEERV